MEQSGRLITIEGAEGVGKSTCVSVVERWLDARGIPHVATREPGGTRLGEQLRSILLARETGAIAPISELLMMFAARAQHVSEFIRPSLEKGTWVVCDRFTDSTYAYQGGGRGISIDLIQRVEDIALQGFVPDLTLVLDLSVAEGQKRVGVRGDRDRFESEQRDFFERVRQTFLDRAEIGDHYRVIDAAGSEPVVARRVGEALTDFLRTRG